MLIDPDKWFAGDVSKKLKLGFLFAHIVIFYWAWTSFSLLGLAVGVLAYVFIGKMGADIGFHRYFTHRTFDVHPLMRKYMLINSTLIGHGSILLWVVTHRIHHAKSDTEDDPHSPGHFGFSNVWLRIWTRENVPNMALVKDLLRDKWIVFLHRHYFKVLWTWLALLIAIWAMGNIYPLLFLFAFPCAGFFHEAGMVNAICHTHGYRPYDTADASRNNLWVNVLTFGNGLHNTHHANATVYTTDIRGKWYEIDPMKYIIKVIGHNVRMGNTV